MVAEMNTGRMNYSGNPKKGNTGLVIGVIVGAVVVALAILAGAYFLLGGFLRGGGTEKSDPVIGEQIVAGTEAPEEESAEADSTQSGGEILLRTESLYFTGEGECQGINLSVVNLNGQDLTYESEDTSVATVSESGMVTAVGNGITNIIVRAGDCEVRCQVECSIPVPEVVSEAPAENTVSPEDADFIFPDSNSRYISTSELDALTEWECAVARNELFARYGYTFTSNLDIRDHFESKSWYHASGRSGEEEMDNIRRKMNSYEVANVDTIRQYEDAHGYNGKKPVFN